MDRCDYCGKSTDGLSHRCKFCGQNHCSEHILPELHNCRGLKKYREGNAERWKKGVLSTVKYESKKEDASFKENVKENKTYHKKTKTSEKLKSFFIEKADGIKNWLRRREHHSYDFERKFNYILTTILIFAVAIVGFSIFYSNAIKLNQMNLWIIRLGGVLILVSLFFITKYGWRIIKEILNLIKRQRNWLKYLIFIIILILLWQTYTHKSEVLNPVFESYNKTDFSRFSPISLGNISFLNDGFSYNYTDEGGNQKRSSFKAQSPLKPKIDTLSLEKEVHDLINQQRQENGISSLVFDEKLATIARLHSQDMAENNFFEHENLQGQDPTDRANAQKYRCYKNFGSYYVEGIAENIFQNNLYDSITYINGIPLHEWNTQSEIAISTVEGWMKSPGHRENILTPTYDKEGIGIAISDDDKVYITQDFC